MIRIVCMIRGIGSKMNVSIVSQNIKFKHCFTFPLTNQLNFCSAIERSIVIYPILLFRPQDGKDCQLLNQVYYTEYYVYAICYTHVVMRTWKLLLILNEMLFLHPIWEIPTLFVRALKCWGESQQQLSESSRLK